MKNLFIYTIFIVLFFSCKKSKTTENNTSSTQTGTITGKITQIDQYGVNLATSLNNVTVSLGSTNFTTITDAAGNYSLSNVPAGMYTLITEKPGCRPYQIQQINFPGNGTLVKDSKTFEYSTTLFNSGSIKDTIVLGSHRLNINIGLNANSNPVGYYILVSNTNNIDITNASTFQLLNQDLYIPSNISNYQYLLSHSLTNGSYFAKIYPYTKFNGFTATYYDYNASKYVYLGYGTPIAQTFTFVVQ